MTTRTVPDIQAVPDLHEVPDHYEVALIVGSVRRARVADAMVPWLVKELASYPWTTLDVIDLAEVDLPLPGPNADDAESPIARRLEQASGFIVLTPEYNHGPPAALKNAIDWHFDEWARKPVAFVGYGAGSGGARAVEALRLIFPELRATTIRDALLIRAPWTRLTDAGVYDGQPDESRALGQVVGELRWWLQALQMARILDAASQPGAPALS